MVTNYKNKKGISLIVLVITIIVLAILASAVIISISNTNIMTKARESTFKSDMQEIKSKYSTWLASYIAEAKTYDINEINYAAKDSYLLNTILGGAVPEKYQSGLKVVKGKLYFDTKDAEQSAVVQEINMAYVSETPTDGSWVAAKGVNSPKLGEGMTGIYWDSNGDEVTVTDANYDNWYDYTNQKWANAKTADGSYWVWIPRYAYKFESGLGTSTAGTISVKFLQGTTDKDKTGTIISKTYPTVTNNAMDAYVVHPAFIDDRANNYMYGGWEAELPGIWVAKYEMSNDGSGNMVSKPGVKSWKSIKIGDIYTKCLAYNSSMQSHMIKNSEWGAVAYLAQSSFGKNGVEVAINDNTSYYTGGAQNATANTNPSQSTTGNNTGIFDMNGGSWEFTAGYISNGNADISSYATSFASTEASNTGYQTLSTQYVTVYPCNNDNDTTAGNYSAYKTANYGYGDAILETSSAGSGAKGWFYDYTSFAFKATPFLLRGAFCSYGDNAGIFCFYGGSGNKSGNSSFRVVLSWV